MTAGDLRRWGLPRAIRCLERGELIAYPTEAVYGLGCDPLDRQAVARLLALKRRPVSKGLILIAADFQQLAPYIRPLPPQRMAPVLASWPGPHTWLLPASPAVPEWLRGAHSTLAVRVTAHPLAAALCRAWGGPLVSTSANRAGQPPATCALRVRCLFHPHLCCVLPGPTGGLERPTPIRDGRSGRQVRI